MLAIFLDQETTGLDSTHHAVVDIAFKIYDLSAGSLLAHYEAIVKQPWEVWEKRDPASVEINGFQWDYFDKGKDPKQVREEIIKIFTDCGVRRGKAVFICQNPAFDRAFFAQLVDVYTQEALFWPYHWLDLASMFWTVRIYECEKKGEVFPKEINLSKDEIAKYFHLPKEIHPHRAMNGVEHLVLCYQAVFDGKLAH